jgi:outer membrane biosynthesis protein TonB
MHRLTAAALLGAALATGSAAETAQAPAAPKPTPAVAAPTSGISQSKFLGLLYSEIAKHTPEKHAAGPGEARASFRVSPQGRIEGVKIERSTSAAHAELVKKILSQVQTPPPPAGLDDIGQTFKFY